ncbi:hypothetical protein [Alterisphingorhabdus coralli]|uniref:Flagellar protein FliT n=1 Tax=Alterisphingorhabdus coralli TaxID=3071408 RepID=A0AA97F5T1_9SPHN|nr:hypothetical protein [Parasphingorhabdus sp. SCSIO 66989]WOE74756.1 hypothetical protein RB602_13035 [Parasphingorhabdus sp. SCSIO 66989]
MTNLIERFEAAQRELIAALDAQDAEAIEAASIVLGPLVEELQGGAALHANAEVKERFENLRNQADAAMFRLDLLQAHTKRRLEMLNDQQRHNAQTYTRPALRAVKA